MPTENFVMSLETLDFASSVVPGGTPLPASGVHVWPAFFKIDGATVSVSDAQDSLGKVIGTATVTGTTGVGASSAIVAGSSTAIPPEAGQWSDQVVPIPLPGGSEFPGFFGMALVVVDPGGLEADVLAAGHAALNEQLQSALNDLISNLPPFPMDVGADQIKELVKEVSDAIDHAIHGAMDLGDWLHVLFDAPEFNNTFAYFSQSELPAVDFDQVDFDPGAEHGPKPFPWQVPFLNAPITGNVSLGGAISRSRRATGEGVLLQLQRPVRAVAGFTSSDGYLHAIAATDDNALTEIYWQGSAPPSSGFLIGMSHQIVGLAGYGTSDGYQHVIVATDDGAVTEVYWQGPNPPGQGSLAQFDHRILAIAGYPSADGYQHVIVATDDGNLTELYWQSGAVGRGTLVHLDSRVVDLAGYEASGVHHVIAANDNGVLTEVTWSGAAAASAQTLGQVAAQPWSHVVGIGAYEAALEQHVIVAMSNGVLREFHRAAGDDQLRHTDLAIIAGITPIIDAFSDANGNQHTIAATTDHAIHELWWSPLTTMIFNPPQLSTPASDDPHMTEHPAQHPLRATTAPTR